MWQSFTFAEYIEVIITKLTEKKTINTSWQAQLISSVVSL